MILEVSQFTGMDITIVQIELKLKNQHKLNLFARTIISNLINGFSIYFYIRNYEPCKCCRNLLAKQLHMSLCSIFHSLSLCCQLMLLTCQTAFFISKNTSSFRCSFPVIPTTYIAVCTQCTAHQLLLSPNAVSFCESSLCGSSVTGSPPCSCPAFLTHEDGVMK